jgi:hypothetical protein
MPSQTAMLAYVAAIVLCFLFLMLVTGLFVGEYCVKTVFLIRVKKHVPHKPRSVRSGRSSRLSVVRV